MPSEREFLSQIDNKQISSSEQEAHGTRFEDIVDADYLKMMSMVEGKSFRVMSDSNLPPDRLGYTDMRTGVIYYNPIMDTGFTSPEGKEVIKPLSIGSKEGFAYHEAGHHSPPAVQFQDGMRERMKDPRIIPEQYRGDAEMQIRYLNSLHATINNCLADVWLESFTGRRPFRPIEQAYKELYSSVVEERKLHSMSAPEQLVQLLVGEARYGVDIKAGQALDPHLAGRYVSPEVVEQYQKIVDTGAMDALMDARVFESGLTSPAMRRGAIREKLDAYTSVFLPAYNKLIEQEVKKRAGSPDSLPLSKQEMDQLRREVLDELTKAGKQFSDHVSNQDQKDAAEKLQPLLDSVKQRAEGNETPSNTAPQSDQSAHDSLKKLTDSLRTGDEVERQRSLSELMKVRQESVVKWDEIKSKYETEIRSTAAALAKIFVSDRRRKTKYGLREGLITPGLEAETIAGILSGDDPKTRMRQVRNPEFLETENEFLNDISGSMSGPPQEQATIMAIIITESFKRVKDILARENLLSSRSEQPFRVGVTTFDTKPYRVTTLEEPLTDEKELKMIEGLSTLGGGTSEKAALTDVYDSLTLRKKNVIKMITVTSDGIGDKGAISGIIQQVEKDDEVIFVAIGMGAAAQDIAETYIAPLRKPENERNVFAIVAEDPKDALPQYLEFLKLIMNRRLKRN